MCGIMGYVGLRPAALLLLEGLGRLEYRGYDSAGIAVLNDTGDLHVSKRVGKLRELVLSLEGQAPSGRLGIGHTRWPPTAGPARTTPTPSRTAPATSLSFTTASSRTTWPSSVSFKRRDTASPQRRTRRLSLT